MAVRSTFTTQPSKTGFHKGSMFDANIDLSDFEPKFDKFMTKTSITALRRGLAKAWCALMDDIVLEIPTAPILTSKLRGSITVFVNRVLHGRSTKYGDPEFQQPKNTEPEWRKGEQATLVVNAPYATIQHEKFPDKNVEGAGMYYVLRKLIQFRAKYAGIVIDELRRMKV